MYNIFQLFLTLYDSILASVFFVIFNGYELKKKFKEIIILTTLLTGATLLSNIGFDFIAILLCVSISFGFMLLFHFVRVSKLRCFCSCILFYGTLMLNNTILFYLFSLYQPNNILELIGHLTQEYIVLCIISKITLSLMVGLYISISNKYENKQDSKNIKVLIIVATANILTICIFTLVLIKSPINTNLASISVLVCIFFNNFINYYMYANLSNKAKMEAKLQIMQHKKEFDYSLFKDSKENHDKIMRLQHDINNHLIHILYCIKSKKYDKAIEYINEISKTSMAFLEHIHLSNEMLNYIINAKMDAAASKSIKFIGNIEDIKHPILNDFDLCILLGNILDNAIEASQNEKINNRYIIMDIYNFSGYEIFEVKNKISSSILDKNRMLTSSKSNKILHGYGLKQIRTIIEKYYGHLDIYERNNYFILKVMIPRI
jgi:two-component system sensor histidine kinase AgrC